MADKPDGDSEPSSDEKIPGASQLAGKIFNQLSISVWLPSIFLVFAVYFVVAYASVDPHLSGFGRVNDAFDTITDRSASGFALAASSVVAITIIVQAFELEAVRLLSGAATPISFFGRRIANLQCAWHRHRRRELIKRLLDAELDAFDDACVNQNINPQVIPELRRQSDCHWLDLPLDAAVDLTRSKKLRNDVNTERDSSKISNDGWAQSSGPGFLRNGSHLRSRLDRFPTTANGVTATALGNLLEASECRIRNTLGTSLMDINALPVRHPKTVTKEVMTLFKNYNDRMKLYCVLTLMTIAGTMTSSGILLFAQQFTISAVSAVVGAFISIVAYRAAYSSAVEYTKTYEEMAIQVRIAETAAERRLDLTSPQPKKLRALIAGLVSGN